MIALQMKLHTYSKFLLFLLLFFGVERLCHRATDGFAMVNVYPPKGDYSYWETEEPFPIATTTLEKPFHYLNSGSQSYVFLSEDGETVLKLFKFQHMRVLPWLDLLPLPNYFSSMRNKKRAQKRAVLECTLSSYQIAFENLREETGILYFSTRLGKKVTIYDKIGKKHTVDLSKTPFVLQKKASLVYDTIDNWMNLGQKEKAEQGLRDLLHLALVRCQKGIFDKDPDFSTNFGFVNHHPVQIDVGRLSLDDKEKKPEVYQDEMIRITRDLQEWIAQNHPGLLPFFDEEIERITTKSLN
ncbi:hypothetical protein [Simkania sp.]|uniref:hypothetical protein n=1 Tax=Simkania sp. TaxID=34094 RepID=UPI003B52250B